MKSNEKLMPIHSESVPNPFGKLVAQISGTSVAELDIMGNENPFRRHSAKMSSKIKAFEMNLSKLAEIDEVCDEMSNKKLDYYPNTNRHILAKTSTNVLSNIKPSPPQSTKNQMQKNYLKRVTPS